MSARGALVLRYDEKAGQAKFRNNKQIYCRYSLVQSVLGYDGNNVMGMSLGGFEETSKGYASTYSYDGKGSSGARDVYLGYTTKDGL